MPGRNQLCGTKLVTLPPPQSGGNEPQGYLARFRLGFLAVAREVDVTPRVLPPQPGGRVASVPLARIHFPGPAALRMVHVLHRDARLSGVEGDAPSAHADARRLLAGELAVLEVRDGVDARRRLGVSGEVDLSRAASVGCIPRVVPARVPNLRRARVKWSRYEKRL